MKQIKHIAAAALALAIAGSLSACGSLSHDIKRDGSSAGQLVWPAPDDTTPLHDGGTWPTPDRLRQIHSGLTKNQIKALIGPPHFSEGVWAVHEWNYLFHLRDPQTGSVHVCQYKVLFDTDQLARSFYWKPESCASFLQQPAKPEPVAPVAGKEASGHQIDVLFAFDQSAFDAIRPEGQVHLHRLADKLTANGAETVSIVVNGYAGRIGDTPYNQALSQRRADTVRDYLVDQGVAADSIKAVGQGTSAPIADCEHARGSHLIACLAPNRRVELVIKPSS